MNGLFSLGDSLSPQSTF